MKKKLDKMKKDTWVLNLNPNADKDRRDTTIQETTNTTKVWGGGREIISSEGTVADGASEAIIVVQTGDTGMSQTN